MRPTPLAPRRALRGVSVLLLLCLAQACPAGEQYYLLVFGSQRVPNEPKYSHSFATFVKVAVGPGGDPVARVDTISWLPRTLDIRVHALLPEEGTNLKLHSTLRYVLSNKERMSRWGPYRIEKELYDWGLEQVCRLESGKVRYKAVDSGYPTGLVSNCIHAIADVTGPYPRLRVISPGWGETASYLLTRRFQRWFLDDGQTHPWVNRLLGLDCYPIIQRELDSHMPRLVRMLFRSMPAD